MSFWKSISGLYLVEIVSAAPAQTLTAVNNAGITLLDFTYEDDLRVKGYVYRRDFKALQKLLSYRGEEITVLRKRGLYWIFRSFYSRPVLIVGMLLFLLMVLYLPTRVLFVQVEGNQNVPTKMIEEKAQQCGVYFGASRRSVRSEKTKNALLSAVPELQWAGVNTVGCVAVISVRERSEKEMDGNRTGVSSVIAARDGVVSNIIALRGNVLCKVGQAVKKDQVLVSGYTDCGISIKAERAEAEIMAFTTRQMQVITPAIYRVRGDATRCETRYSLQFGKNIINLWKDSGISDATCVKIYKVNHLTLPGGFQLPISVISETLTYYSSTDNACLDFEWVEPLSKQYLIQSMTAGIIVDSNINTELNDSVLLQNGQYFCEEMIGQVHSEEIIQDHGKTNRQNS